MYLARMSMRSAPASLKLLVKLLSGLVFLSSCSKRIPNEVAPAVETNLPIAIQVAENAAKSCPDLKANHSMGSPQAPSPAKGSALETNMQVVDVSITCMWPDPRDSTGATGEGTAFPRLKGKSAVPLRAVTMPEDFARTTCQKDPNNCEQVVVPSRHVASESSADIRVVRKTPVGTVEVVVILAP